MSTVRATCTHKGASAQARGRAAVAYGASAAPTDSRREPPSPPTAAPCGDRRRGPAQRAPPAHGHRLPRAGRTVVLIPAAFSPAEERRWVAQMVAKLQTREERRRRSLGGDDELMARARALSAAHLDGLAEPASVRWVDNQHRRWGSCTPADRSIRLSSRLRSMPDYVVDYVLVHELVHLLEPGHDDALLGAGRALPAGRAGARASSRASSRPPRGDAGRGRRPRRLEPGAVD